MSEDLGYLSGEVTDAVPYEPPAKGRYVASILRAEYVDPVALGWELREPGDERIFPRIHWQIEAGPNGAPTEYAGRWVSQRINMRPGINPKTGRAYQEALLDVLRLRHGLGKADSPQGLTLIDLSDLDGTDRATVVQTASARLTQALVGLKATIRIEHMKDRDGNPKEIVAKIIL